MHHVFISYSRADLTVVDAAAARLEQLGIHLWIDRRDIPVSVPWWEEVTAGIEACDLFVVCDSASWRSSQACQLEYDAAQTAHKRIIVLDVAAKPPGVLADEISAAVRNSPPAVWVHTEAAVRTAMWVRSGRRPAGLVRGAVLRQMRSLVRQGRPPLPSEAHEFVSASRSRSRRRRAGGWVGGSLAVLSLLVCCTGATLRQASKDIVGNANANLSRFLFAEEELEQDPYAMLAVERDQLRNERTGYLDHLLMTKALLTPVPDASYVVDGRKLVGFAARVSAGEPAVVDERGVVHQGGPASTVPTEGAPAQPLVSVTGSDDGATGLHLTAGGGTVRVGDRPRVTVPTSATAAVSADGTRLLTVAAGKITVTDLRRGGTLEVKAPQPCCTAVAFSGADVVLGGPDGSISVWRPGGKVTRVWSRPQGGPVQRIAASADGSHVAVVLRDDGLVHVLATPGYAPHQTLAVGGSRVPAFSPDGSMLAVARGPRIVVLDRRTGGAITTLVGSSGDVRDMSWAKDSRRIHAVAGEHRIVSWPVRHGHPLVEDPKRWFVAVTRPAEDGRIAAVDRGGDVLVVAADGRSVLSTLQSSAREVIGAAMRPDGSEIAIASSTRTIVIRPLSGTPERRFDADCNAVRVAYPPDGRRLYLTCLTGQVRAYDAGDGHLIAGAVLDHRAQPIPIVVNGRGDVLVGDAWGAVHQFDADLSKQSVLMDAECNLPLRGLAVNGGGDTIVSAGDGAIHLGCMYELHRAGGKWNRIPHPQPLAAGEQARAVDMTVDGRVAVIGLSDGWIRLWRPDDTLNPVGAYHESGGEIWGASFTRDGRQIVVGTRDGLLMALPGCPLCGSDADLADEADRLIVRARGFGLTDR